MIEGTRNDDRIRARANKIWKTEGRPDGKALKHWLQAERELAVEPAKESDAGADGASKRFRRRTNLIKASHSNRA